MKRFFTFFTGLLFSFSLFSQTRYAEDIFGFTKHANIVYGQNYDNQDSLWNLRMDIYEPENDTAALRPVIYFVHGGSFISNSRTDQSIHKKAEGFAKKGYVTVNIEYRTEQSDLPTPYLNFLDANNWFKAIARATQDLKAAIRYLKKDVAVNNNRYRVDTSSIFLYGTSAGAITVLHAAYLDDTSEMRTSLFNRNYKELGGLDGNSGSPGYSMAGIKAVVSCSGAIERLDYLNNNPDIAYLGFHHAIDPVVPFDAGCFDVVACWLGTFNGANKIYPKTRNLGMNAEFYKINKIGHPADAVDDTVTSKLVWEKTTDFLYRIMSPAVPTAVHGNPVKSLELFPNPSNGRFKLMVPEQLLIKDASVAIIALDGTVVYSAPISKGTAMEFNLQLPDGMYILSVKNSAETYLSKITIVH